MDSPENVRIKLSRSNGTQTEEWYESLEQLLRFASEHNPYFIQTLLKRLSDSGVNVPAPVTTPYVNTIPVDDEPEYPGDRDLERRIKSIIRWNAMAMVVKANSLGTGVGGHISTYASLATLYEVGFNHFFRGPDGPASADLVFFQGHASPGNYSRAFVEGRLTEKNLHNFRQ